MTASCGSLRTPYSNSYAQRVSNLTPPSYTSSSSAVSGEHVPSQVICSTYVQYRRPRSRHLRRCWMLLSGVTNCLSPSVPRIDLEGASPLSLRSHACLDAHTVWRLMCSRAVAYRFGQYLDTAVPLVARFSESTGDGEEELSESCLQARPRSTSARCASYASHTTVQTQCTHHRCTTVWSLAYASTLQCRPSNPGSSDPSQRCSPGDVLQ